MNNIQIDPKNGSICHNFSQKAALDAFKKQFKWVTELKHFILDIYPQKRYYHYHAADQEYTEMVESLSDIKTKFEAIESEVRAALFERFSTKPFKKTEIKLYLFEDLKNDIDHHQQRFKLRKKDKDRQMLDRILCNIFLNMTSIKEMYLDFKKGLKGKSTGYDRHETECKTPSNSEGDESDENDDSDDHDINNKLLDYEGFKGESEKMKHYNHHYDDSRYINDKDDEIGDNNSRHYKYYNNHGNGCWQQYRLKQKSVKVEFFRTNAVGQLLKEKEIKKFKLKESLKTLEDLQQKIEQEIGIGTKYFLFHNKKMGKLLKDKQEFKCYIRYKHDLELETKGFNNWREYGNHLNHINTDYKNVVNINYEIIKSYKFNDSK